MPLKDNTIMISVASEVYNKEKPDEIRIPPNSFGDVWTTKYKNIKTSKEIKQS